MNNGVAWRVKSCGRSGCFVTSGSGVVPAQRYHQSRRVGLRLDGWWGRCSTKWHPAMSKTFSNARKKWQQSHELAASLLTMLPELMSRVALVITHQQAKVSG